MADPTAYEEMLREEIQLLRDLVQAEAVKHQFLINADLDAFEDAQMDGDELFARLVELDGRRKNTGKRMSLDSLTIEAKRNVAALNEDLRQATTAANEANLKNQRLLESLTGELKKQIEHVRKGRKALAGYGRGLGRAKPVTLISDDF